MSNQLQLTVYPARPYAPDGDFEITGVLLIAVAGFVVAVVLASITSVIGQFFYIPFVFPLLLGSGVGLVLGQCVSLTQTRNRLICGILGFVSGLAAVGSLHYADYVIFAKVVESADHGILRHALEPEDAAELRAAKRVNSFPSYLQYSAEQGVEFSFHDASMFKLGFKGTIIYWVLEGLAVLLCALAIPFMQAEEPFCVRCDSWMKKKDMGHLKADPEEVEGVIQSGRLQEFSGLRSTSDCAIVSAYLCPQCQYDGEAVFFVSRMQSSDSDGKRNELESKTVLPGEAAYKLTVHFEEASVERQLTAVAEQREHEMCATN